METNVVHKSDWLLAIEGKVEPDEVKKEREKLLRRFAKKVKVQGFRQGKAPLTMIASRYEEEIRTELVEEFASRAFRKALDDEKIRPITRGKLSYWNFIEADELRFEVEVEVLPEIDVHGYRKIKLEPVPPPSSEELVEKRLENLRQRSARVEPVERESREGDYLRCDYSVYRDGVKRDRQKGVLIQLGDPENFPEINQALTGKRVGDIAQAEITYPEDAGNMAGKKATYKFFVHEVKEKKVPETDDEFAKELGFKTLDEMRSKLAQDAGKEAERITQDKREDQIFAQLLEQHPFDSPPVLVEERTLYLLRRLRLPDTPETRERLTPKAEEHVKLDLILEAIAEKEEIAVSEEELDAWFRERAGDIGAPVTQARSLWRPERAREEARRRKTIDFLLECAAQGGLIVYPDSH
ncbi:trigger factor [candidate division WOR-3 bacterium]|nr:trigger factor [candidate division WOR-3 bacterium]